MKVLWVTSGYPWSGNLYGGVFHQTQAQALSRLGVQIAVEAAVPWIPRLAARLSQRYALQRSAPSHQVEGKLQIHRLCYFAHRSQTYFGWPHLILAHQLEKKMPFMPDLIHAHFAYPMGLAAVKVARKLGIPSLITLHGSDVNVDPKRSWLGLRRFQRAVAGADRVLCVSEALRDRTLQLTGRQVDYLPIGINLQRFSASMAREQARAALELPLDRPIVLYVGNLLSSKGVAVALEALAHPALADTLGLFVGAGPLGPAIRAQANCQWRESVPNPKIVEYLSAADMLILPSYAEGLPTVLVEAGACGTPVIATEVGGIPRLLQQDRGTLIAPGAVGALRQAILQNLQEPVSAQEKAARLRDHVQDAYNAERNAELLLQIYEKCLGNG